MSKKFALLLSGCGYLDGSEINETVFAMLGMDKNEILFDAFALNKTQEYVIDHNTKQQIENETRNMMSEACRITRKIHDAADLKASDYDALIIPGGFGVAKNFSNLALANESFTVVHEVERIIIDFLSFKKPIGAICIAPAIVSKALKENGYDTVVTLGNENKLLKSIGVQQKTCNASDTVVDYANKIVTTPAFMLDARLSEIASGIERLIQQVKELC